MSALDAAETVLAEARTPLHYDEITRRVLKSDAWHTDGLTPEATISALLSVDLKKHGPSSRFQRVGPGIYALRAWDLPAPAPSEPTSEPQPPALPETPPVASALSFTDAAERVIEQFGHRKPMHYKAITDTALEMGLVSTKGQTPAATLYAQVLTETKRRISRGDPPRFVMHGEGYIGLSKWVIGGLAFQIERHNNEVRQKLHAHLLAMPPADFEALISRLLVALGFEDVEVTPASGDGGIDVRGTLVVGDVIRTRMAVQVKRWKHNVQAPIVQQVRGSLGTHDQGLIITTSDFSKGACTEAERRDAVPVALMNGEQLVALLVENKIGVHSTQYDLIEMGESEEE